VVHVAVGRVGGLYTVSDGQAIRPTSCLKRYESDVLLPHISESHKSGAFQEKIRNYHNRWNLLIMIINNISYKMFWILFNLTVWLRQYEFTTEITPYPLEPKAKILQRDCRSRGCQQGRNPVEEKHQLDYRLHQEDCSTGWVKVFATSSKRCKF
jgi:hypothetical protein